MKIQSNSKQNSNMITQEQAYHKIFMKEKESKSSQENFKEYPVHY